MQVVVLVMACCVDWLVQHAPLDSQLGSSRSVEAVLQVWDGVHVGVCMCVCVHMPCSVSLLPILQACLQQKPSSVEALHSPSLPAGEH